MHLIYLEEKYILCVVSNRASEISSNNTVPCSTKLFVTLLLDIGCHVFFNLEFVHSLIYFGNALGRDFRWNISTMDSNLLQTLL
jgi:hypothetical protein